MCFIFQFLFSSLLPCLCLVLDACNGTVGGAVGGQLRRGRGRDAARRPAALGLQLAPLLLKVLQWVSAQVVRIALSKCSTGRSPSLATPPSSRARPRWGRAQGAMVVNID